MIVLVFLINYLDHSGPGRVLVDLISSLDKSVYDISVVTLFRGNNKNVISDVSKKCKVIELNKRRKYRYLFLKDKQLLSFISGLKPDIVHSHGIIPDIVNSNLQCNCKKITTLHNFMFEDYIFGFGKLFGSILCKIHLKALSIFDQIVCCSSSILTRISDKIPNENLTFVRNSAGGYDSSNVIKRKDLNIPEDGFVYLFVGRLCKLKQTRSLIDDFLKYHLENEYLVLVGDGPDYEYAKSICQRNLIVLGHRTNARDYYSVANCYISYSQSEGFSIAVLDAVHQGLPLLLSNIPSHAELFDIDRELYLGELFNYGSFDKAIGKFRNNYSSVNNDIIKDFFDKNLSLKVMASSYSSIYLKMVGTII